MRPIAVPMQAIPCPYRWPLLLCAAMLILSCSAKAPPLSPAAATFKQEMKTCITNLSAALMEPVANKDVAAINAALVKMESPAVKLCRLCPFQVGVLDRVGEVLATYPAKSDNGNKNYSGYDLIAKAIASKKIQQQRFFLQDGTKLYIICVPLLRANNLVGLIAIAVNSEDPGRRWGLTEKDFMSINFNN
jgi:hypothetical protein